MIAGDFIGTDVSGLLDLGKGGTACISTTRRTTRIGGDGPGDSNLISGNESNGVDLVESGADVVGNVIGVDRTAQEAIVNGVGGIEIHSDDDVDADASSSAHAPRQSRPTRIRHWKTIWRIASYSVAILSPIGSTALRSRSSHRNVRRSSY